MRALVYAALVVVLDQISKYLVRSNLEVHSTIKVLGDFFRLTYVENSGIVFGIGVGGALPFFTALSVIATVLIVYFFIQERSNQLGVRISLALVLGGAIGNLIDRLVFGKVVDFLDFGIGNYRFFVFNVADSAVTVGVFSFLIITTFIIPGRAKKLDETNESG